MVIVGSRAMQDIFVCVRKGPKVWRIFREEWAEVERVLHRADERAKNEYLVRKALKKRNK